MKRIIMLLAILFQQAVTYAQTNPTTQGLPYTQNFNSVNHTSTSYPAGWQGWTVSTAPGTAFNTATPTADRTLTASSTAGVNSGNVHNYNGKIGFLNTGSLDLSLVLAVNTTNYNNVKISYDIMTLRNPHDGASNTRINEVTLQYRVGTSGSFTTLTGMEYQNNTTTQTSSVTTPQNTSTKLVSLPAACNNQSVVQLRWASRQVSGGGSRPSFAVDNILVDSAINPTFSVAKGTDGSEGVTPVAGSFIFSFNQGTTGSTTFNYAISGTATFNTDYTVTLSGGATPATLTSATGTITVPISSSAINATITPINDALSEGTETVRIVVSNPSGSYVRADSSATLNITDDEATRIHAIQDTGANAIQGMYTVEAIVTGVYTTLSPAGFYMQEEDADIDNSPLTSEGIFVVTSTAVAPGDKVRVTGTVIESSSSPSFQQAVINNTTVTILSSSNPLPTATVINLPVSDVSDYEHYEGMLVRFPDTLTVTDNYTLGRFGEINLSKGGIAYTPTQFVDPNDAISSGTTTSGNSNLPAVTAYGDSNRRRTIMLDDGKGNMTVLPYANPADSTLRLGTTTHNLTGIMGYAFSVYRIQPVPHAYPTFTYAARPTAVPTVGANANVKAASFNVLNYFNGDGQGGGYPTARGAHSALEFTRQRVKIINAIAEIDADVVGLIELENDGTAANSALQDLINGLNTKMGANTYSFIDDGATIQTNCTDAIRCAIIYKSSKVTPTGAVMISSDAVFNRPPVAQTFSLDSNSDKFVFIVNHFKSKGCSGSSGADADLGDGQSCYNQTRLKQTGALNNFIKNTIIPTSGTNMVLTVGDYNAYFEEDPMDSFRSAGYKVLGAPSSYSYLFFGQVGSLDNAVVSDSLSSKVTGIAKWNINSAEPPYLDYNDTLNDGSGDFSNTWGNLYNTSVFRSSDHDPIIVGLDLKKPVVGIAMQTMADFKVYPNPAGNYVFIENKAGKQAQWQFMNMTGQVVLSGQINDSHAVVDVNGLVTGIYLLKLTVTGGAAQVVRIVKQ